MHERSDRAGPTTTLLITHAGELLHVGTHRVGALVHHERRPPAHVVVDLGRLSRDMRRLIGE